MTGKRGGDKTIAIDNLDLSLRSRFVMVDRLDLALQLAVVDGRGQHALASVANAFGQRGGSPAEFGANSDLSLAARLRLAASRAWRFGRP